MKKFLAVCVMTLMAASQVWADPTTQRQAAEELLVVMDVKGNVDRMLNDVISMHEAQFAAAGSKTDATVKNAFIDELKNALSWESVKEDYVKIYTDVFAEDEIRALVDFYKSPIGQKLVAKQPELMEKSMELSQKRFMETMPRLMSLMQEAMPEPEDATTPAGGNTPATPAAPAAN